jgi:hypothetical protein
MTKRSVLLPSALALLAACGQAGSGTTGAMGQSSTTPECAPNDTSCQSDGLDAPIAVGARVPLDVNVTSRGVATPALKLEPARGDILDVDGIRLVGKAEGASSVLITTNEGLVLDFFTITVAKPERLELYRLTKDGAPDALPLPDKIQLTSNDEIEITVKPFAQSTRLLGELDASWSLEGNIGIVLDAGRSGSRRFVVKNAGTGTLKVGAGPLSKALTIEVFQ